MNFPKLEILPVKYRISFTLRCTFLMHELNNKIKYAGNIAEAKIFQSSPTESGSLPFPQLNCSCISRITPKAAQITLREIVSSLLKKPHFHNLSRLECCAFPPVSEIPVVCLPALWIFGHCLISFHLPCSPKKSENIYKSDHPAS